MNNNNKEILYIRIKQLIIKQKPKEYIINHLSSDFDLKDIIEILNKLNYQNNKK